MQRLELGGGVRLYTDHAAGYRQWRRYARYSEATEVPSGVDILWLQAPEMIRLPDAAAGIGSAGDGRMILNRHAGPWSGPAMRERLRLWGLPVMDRAAWDAEPRSDPSCSGFVRTLCFWVSQLEAVAAAHCSQAPSGSYFYRPLNDWAQAPYLRLARLAVRAVYALGLDTGAVMLRCCPAAEQPDTPAGVLEEPHPGDAIVRVEPVPAPLPAWVLESYAASWAKVAAEQQSARARPGPLLMGIDAELVLHDARRRKLIAASRFLPRGGRAGCDAVRIGGRVRFPLMELRPD
ncbi:putative amidoligase domain-containing protein, partial [Paenibacillus popilliae]